jgi:hypothetical protein
MTTSGQRQAPGSRDIVAVAVAHFVAAKAGDAARKISLGAGFDDLQDMALFGDATASRLLGEMHYLGLGVAENQPLAWTWVKWAKDHCEPPADPHEATEVEVAFIFYEIYVNEAARAEGERVLASLVQPLPQILVGTECSGRCRWSRAKRQAPATGQRRHERRHHPEGGAANAGCASRVVACRRAYQEPTTLRNDAEGSSHFLRRARCPKRHV